MIRHDAKIKIEYRTDNMKPPERKIGGFCSGEVV